MMTCECGYVVRGESDGDVLSIMESHIKNDHADRKADHEKMLNSAKKTLMEAADE